MEVAVVGSTYRQYYGTHARPDPPPDAPDARSDVHGAEATGSASSTESARRTNEPEIRTAVTEYTVYDPRLGQYINLLV